MALEDSEGERNGVKESSRNVRIRGSQFQKCRHVRLTLKLPLRHPKLSRFIKRTTTQEQLVKPEFENIFFSRCAPKIIITIIKAALKSLGGPEKRKDRKSRGEEKVVGFRSASLFPATKLEAVTQGGSIEPGE